MPLPALSLSMAFPLSVRIFFEEPFALASSPETCTYFLFRLSQWYCRLCCVMPAASSAPMSSTAEASSAAASSIWNVSSFGLLGSRVWPMYKDLSLYLPSFSTPSPYAAAFTAASRAARNLSGPAPSSSSLSPPSSVAWVVPLPWALDPTLPGSWALFAAAAATGACSCFFFRSFSITTACVARLRCMTSLVFFRPSSSC
mmetsp:Transcript_14899/g.40157  ORF Transcript_14899/g.40157 Transcript_14899/m.40157 type:complete len:200 (+) Transcript_14899:597-1196(+)